MKKLIFLFSAMFILSINVKTTADGANFLTGMLVGGAISSSHSKDVSVPAQENAIMLRFTTYYGYRQYNLNNGKLRMCVRVAHGCEEAKFEEYSITEWLSSNYPGYKSYSIQPGHNEVFIFITM